MSAELRPTRKAIKLENINQDYIYDLIASAKKFTLDNSLYLECGENEYMKYHTFLNTLNKIVFDYAPKEDLITVYKFNIHFDFNGNALFEAHIENAKITYKPYKNMKELASFITTFIQGKIPDFTGSDYTVLDYDTKYDSFNYDDSVFIYITDLTDLVNGYYPDVLINKKNKLLNEFIYYIRDMLFQRIVHNPTK